MTQAEQGFGLVHGTLKRNAGEASLYLVPMLFCLAVHWTALNTWFTGDDFAWLGLRLDTHGNLQGWLDVLFGPRAQGTIRTLSERVYFLVFTGLFGLNALPFRIWAFLTQFANIALLIAITRRLTGSRRAAFLAALLWCSNAGLAVSLGWSSAYNEICFTFLVLASFWCLLRFIETGQRRYWIWQWTTYLLGFGALELMVVYPAIAALYTGLFARRYFRRTLWLFLPSAAFTIFHFLYVPAPHDALYTLHFDTAIPVTLWKYWSFAAAAARTDPVDWRPIWLGVALAIAVAIGCIWLLIKKPRLTLFCAGWFLIILIPVLPLKFHVKEYYLTAPSLGLAILGALALVSYPRVAAILAGAYLVVSISDLQVAERYVHDRSLKMRNLVQGLEAESPKLRDKVVLLSGVDDDLFWSGFFDEPFRLLGIKKVYLTPGSEKTIKPHPEWGGVDGFVLSQESALFELANQAVVLAVNENGVQEITKTYGLIAGAQYRAVHGREYQVSDTAGDVVEAGDPKFAKRLGPGWYAAEGGHRWMGKSASVQLSGPRTGSEHLVITGYCPEVVVAQGPIELQIALNGHTVGTESLGKPGGRFSLTYPVPRDLIGQDAVTVSLEVNRTITVEHDNRALGLVFGTIRMK